MLSFNAFLFYPHLLLDEEAAAGPSDGALVYYLHQHSLVRTDKVYIAVQGEIER